MTFYDALEHHGRAVALETAEGATTYAQLAEAADRVAAELRIGRLAFLLAQNSRAAVAGYLGFLRSKTPVALQPAGLRLELLGNLLKTYRPHYVWLPREKRGSVPGGKEVLAIDEYLLIELDAESVDIQEGLAVLMTTSGSTGSPKLVRQSFRNIEVNAASIAQYLDVSEADRPITTLPMSYVYGLSVLNSHLLRGASIVLTEASVIEKQFWELLRAKRASSLAGVPYTFQMLKRLRFASMDLPSLRVITQAGGKLDTAMVTELASLCRDRGMRFYVMYGAAEATARMSYLPPDLALTKPGSIGIAIPEGRFTIEDRTGATIQEPDTVGELVYYGENVAWGYASEREDLALGDCRGGVLHTGDLAQRDRDGFYYIVGRKSRFLKIFGNRVNLDDVEQHVRKHGVDCACAGEDDKLRIYVADASQRTAVGAIVQKLTGLHWSAVSVIPIAEIPRNEFGKTMYSALR